MGRAPCRPYNTLSADLRQSMEAGAAVATDTHGRVQGQPDSPARHVVTGPMPAPGLPSWDKGARQLPSSPRLGCILVYRIHTRTHTRYIEARHHAVLHHTAPDNSTPSATHASVPRSPASMHPTPQLLPAPPPPPCAPPSAPSPAAPAWLTCRTSPSTGLAQPAACPAARPPPPPRPPTGPTYEAAGAPPAAPVTPAAPARASGTTRGPAARCSTTLITLSN